MAVYTTQSSKRVYALRGSGRKWQLECWSSRSAEAPDWTYALDFDARHRRLFLSDHAERKVGIAGISALEVLARRALGHAPSSR